MPYLGHQQGSGGRLEVGNCYHWKANSMDWTWPQGMNPPYIVGKCWPFFKATLLLQPVPSRCSHLFEKCTFFSGKCANFLYFTGAYRALYQWSDCRCSGVPADTASSFLACTSHMGCQFERWCPWTNWELKAFCFSGRWDLVYSDCCESIMWLGGAHIIMLI